MLIDMHPNVINILNPVHPSTPCERRSAPRAVPELGAIVGSSVDTVPLDALDGLATITDAVLVAMLLKGEAIAISVKEAEPYATVAEAVGTTSAVVRAAGVELVDAAPETEIERVGQSSSANAITSLKSLVDVDSLSGCNAPRFTS
jgi:hypothetical protein